MLLSGCSELILFNSKGPIADSEHFLILVAFGLMLIVVLPVFVMAFWFARKYRASNTKADYRPNWAFSTKIELAIWLVPIIIVTILSYLAWTTSFQLDPYKPINPHSASLNIEVVSLDWNWLFIYPEQNIAVVNELVFPVNVPLSFKLTSATVLTSFFIPQLGSQMYVMAGMQTRLNLMADEPGVFVGQNQEFSGAGYSTMHFKAISTSPEKFKAWTQKAKESPNKLNLATYENLAKPNVDHDVTLYSSVEPDLFAYIMRQFNPNLGRSPDRMNRTASANAKTIYSAEEN